MWKKKLFFWRKKPYSWWLYSIFILISFSRLFPLFFLFTLLNHNEFMFYIIKHYINVPFTIKISNIIFYLIVVLFMILFYKKKRKREIIMAIYSWNAACEFLFICVLYQNNNFLLTYWNGSMALCDILAFYIILHICKENIFVCMCMCVVLFASFFFFAFAISYKNPENIRFVSRIKEIGLCVKCV